MTVAQFLATLERRAQEAEALGAQPVAVTLRRIAAELPTVDGLPEDEVPKEMPQTVDTRKMAAVSGLSESFLRHHAKTLPFAVKVHGKRLWDVAKWERWKRLHSNGT